MDAPVVAGGVYEVIQMSGLRVSAKHRIVISRSRRLHRSEALTVHIRCEEARSNQPVGFCRSLVECPLFNQRTEHIREGLIERPGLVPINQFGFILGDPVRQLMPNNIDSDGNLTM